MSQSILKMEKHRNSILAHLASLHSDEFDKANDVMKRVSLALCPALARHICQRHEEMVEGYQSLLNKTDLTKPHEWYLHARLDKRKIVYHGGPTNSGKTYEAVQRLKTAEKGLYLGPLRLLAAEIYVTLTSQGVYTNLYTGQVKEEIPFSTHTAATVETAPLDREFDVVIIDEIQMIADRFRGFAWTRALLGLRCKEIHVCGGLEAVDIVKKIVEEQCGDEFELKTYERFSTLSVSDYHLTGGEAGSGCYQNVQPGDCVVAFSRNDIFAIKREVETLTNYKCSVIYGSLPPQTRTDQARRFNDQNSGYDVLIASDAIGMGLNLNIKRIIFNSMYKIDGDGIAKLDHSAVKQISGRAGRRNSPFPNGDVTCRDPDDLEYLRELMSRDVPQIKKAGLLPTSSHIKLFYEALGEFNNAATPHVITDGTGVAQGLHRTLRQFQDMATLQGDFFLCRQSAMNVISKWLSHVPLSVEDKYMFCMAPVNTDNPRMMRTLTKFAEKYSRGEHYGLSHHLFALVGRTPESFEQLSVLCSLHNELELFLWLSMKFPGNLIEQQSAMVLKEQAIAMINYGLSNTDQLTLDHSYIGRDAELRAAWLRQREEMQYEDDDDDLVSYYG